MRRSKALRKEFYMAVKKTYNRFISICLIVMLGTAFFSGVKATQPDMERSADALYDTAHLMDIRVLSTLGVTEKDLEAIRSIEGVEAAEPGYSQDFLTQIGEDEYVFKTMSIGTDINQVLLDEGRMPEKDDECIIDNLVSERQGLRIGDQVTLKSGNDTAIEDTLKTATYTIVGRGRMATYLNLTRGSSQIGQGSVTGFMLIPRAAFTSDYYTEIVVKVAGAEALNTYDPAYEALVDEVEDRIKALEDERCLARFNEVKQEGQDKIDEGQQEIDDAERKIKDAEDELKDAREQLDDGHQKIEDAEKTLNDAKDTLAEGEQKLADAAGQIAEGEAKLQDGETAYQKGLSEYQNGKKAYEEGLKTYNENVTKYQEGKDALAEGKKTLDATKTQLDAAKTTLDTSKTQLETTKTQLDTAKATLDATKTQLETSKAQLDASKATLDTTKAQLDASRPAIEAAKQQLPGLISQHEQLVALIAQMKAAGLDTTEYELQCQALEEGIAEINTQVSTFEAYETQYNQGVAQYEAGLAQYQEGETQYKEGLAQYKEGEKKYKQGLEKYEAGEAEYNEGLAQYKEGLAQYKEKKAELQEAKTQLDSGKSKLDASKSQLEAANQTLQSSRETLNQGYSTLNTSKQQYADGVKELEDGRQEIKDHEVELEDAKAELESHEKEYADGLKSYEDAKAEHEPEIEDGKQKLQDAKEKLAELEMPKWYVLDRDYVETCVEYKQDAQRIGNIGNVFPVIFFLVAALVSLTTMTRMVEEERTQIGTLKALGYSKGSIMAKYVLYAFFATLIGGGIGTIVGQKLLPWVIMRAYGILYVSIKAYLTPIHVSFTVFSMAAAMVCTIVAVLAACYKELLSVPAQLMRPVAPQIGKRVWLEYLPFIWKHLSFSYKAALRNLFRYKKRFFMTIIGIGGCMGLLMVGFGLKDSIMTIGDRQYETLHLYDATVSFVEDEDGDTSKKEEAYQKLSNDPVVTKAMMTLQETVDFSRDDTGKGEKNGLLMVPSVPGTISDFINLTSRTTGETYQLSDEGVVITEKLSSLLNLSIGDDIYLKIEDMHYEPVKILGIVENYYYHYMYMTPAMYEKLYNEPANYNQAFVCFNEDSEEVEDAFSQTYLQEEAVNGISFSQRMSKKISDMITSLNAIVYVIIVAAGLLAFVVLYNLNNINISERRRELATLKVLGFFDMEVSAYVFRENIFLTLIGAALGIFFGKALHMFVITTAEIDLMMFGRSIYPRSYILSVVLTFVFSIIVNGVMHRKLKKLDMIESMKSVE